MKLTATTEEMMQEALGELFTLRDLLRWGLSQFRAANLYYGHGMKDAWDEVVYLTLHALHLPLELNTEFLDATLTYPEKIQVIKLILRRMDERLPAAYLTQEAWFAGLPFYVDQRVLIPRSPIAELIQQQFTPWVVEENVQHILDLCKIGRAHV